MHHIYFKQYISNSLPDLSFQGGFCFVDLCTTVVYINAHIYSFQYDKLLENMCIYVYLYCDFEGILVISLIYYILMTSLAARSQTI